MKMQMYIKTVSTFLLWMIKFHKQYSFSIMSLILALMLFLSCASEKVEVEPDGQFEKANENSGSIRTWTDSLTGMEFIWISGECFDMGQSETEATDLKKNPEAYEHLSKEPRKDREHNSVFCCG